MAKASNRNVNQRTGVDGVRLLVVGRDWPPPRFGKSPSGLARIADLDACSGVLFHTNELSPLAIADALRAADQGKLFVWGHLGPLNALVHSRTHYVGDITNECEAAELASVGAAHATEPMCVSWPEEALELIRAVESPAEARLAVAMIRHVCEPGWEVAAQVPIGRYRADFTVTNNMNVKQYNEIPCRLVVEVDGHEWHERTKGQAARDKSRDRAIQADGWRVLRFTGSEVWNDPVSCAREIAAIQRRVEAES